MYILENTFGDQIRKYRLRKDLTQEKLAELCSVSPPTISRWETGSLNPSREHQIQLTAILGIQFDKPFSSAKPEPSYSPAIHEIIAILNKMKESEQELVLDFIISFEKYLNR